MSAINIYFNLFSYEKLTFFKFIYLREYIIKTFNFEFDLFLDVDV